MEHPAVIAFETVWKERHGLLKAASVPKLPASTSSKIRLVFPATNVLTTSDECVTFK
jgi:hypothetical protein